jgi:FKBP-type peptidyl-prolyl cis-trans isomerase SlyD
MTAKHRVVSIHYTLTDDTGTVLDSSQGAEPLQYLEGAGNIIPGLEKEVSSMTVGQKKKVVVSAKEGYGEKQSELVIQVPRAQFPADLKLKVGDRFRTSSDHHSPVFTVISTEGEQVTLDGNHPLAGKTLNFDVEVTEARDATLEEISHGHVHGPGGHHHH